MLTAAGEILAVHARRSRMDAEHALEGIQALQGLRSGLVRVAATEGFSGDFLPRLMQQFRLLHPHIQFQLAVLPPAEVPQQVRQADADMGLTFSRQPERDIRVEYRQPAPLLAVMRPDHPLARHKSVTLRAMCAHPLALPMPSTTVRQMIDIACSRQQLPLEPVLTTSNWSTLIGFVGHGGGLTVSGEVSIRQMVAAGTLRGCRSVTTAWRCATSSCRPWPGAPCPMRRSAFWTTSRPCCLRARIVLHRPTWFANTASLCSQFSDGGKVTNFLRCGDTSS